MPPGRRSSSPRCERRAHGRPRVRRSRASGTPSSIATAAAASRFSRLPVPSSGVSTRELRRAASSASPPCRRGRDARRHWRAPAARSDKPKVRILPANRPARARIRVVVGVGDEQIVGPRLLEDLRPWRRRSRRRTRRSPACASPTLVQTRTSGSAMPTSVRISPAWFMPEFDHRHVRPRAQLEQRERQADVIVQVAPVPKHRVLRRQELRRQLLRRRLARAAGDRDDLRARAPAHLARAVLQRPRRVGHLDEKRRRPGLSCLGQGRRRRHHRAGRTRGQRSGDELVPVEPIAADRDEQVARLQRPRVDRPPLDALRRVARTPPGRRSAAAISAALSEIGWPPATSPAIRCGGAPAPRAPPPRRRTAASCRRSPGTSRAPCRR